MTNGNLHWVPITYLTNTRKLRSITLVTLPLAKYSRTHPIHRTV